MESYVGGWSLLVFPGAPVGWGAPGGRYITMMETIPPVRGSGAVVVDMTWPPASLLSSLVVVPAPSLPSLLSASKSSGVRKLIRFHCKNDANCSDRKGDMQWCGGIANNNLEKEDSCKHEDGDDGHPDCHLCQRLSLRFAIFYGEKRNADI